MYKRFKSVSLMMLLMGLPAGVALAHQASSDVTATQQNAVVKGTVRDAMGEALTGASVVVKGTTNGAMVDSEGNFVIRNVKRGATLRITSVGYKTQEVVWQGEPLDIVLEEIDSALNEAVVIGYGVAKKNDMTGSVTAIKPDEKNKGLVVNAQDMIQGKIAGVSVTSSSGTPGGGATIRIRGGSSLNASNDPLIVIDGLAMDNKGVKGLSNPLSMVNPADIESFTVLKDASATAIYGSRGSNGVIIITTKKGRAGSSMKVAYNGNMSLNMRRKSINMLNGDQFRALVKSQYGENSDAFRALGTANTNWQDEIYRPALAHDHNITLSGSMKQLPYRLSLGYTNQDGILKTSNFERFTAGLNLNPTLLDEHLKVNLSAKYMNAATRYGDNGAIGAALYMDPTQPIKSNDEKYKNFGGYWQWIASGKELKDPTYPYTKNSLATANPVAMLNQKDEHARSHAAVGNLELDYKIHGWEDLHLHANLGADYSTGKQTTIISPFSGTNHYYGHNGWEEIDKYNLSFNTYAQYLKDFNEAHHFDVMAGYEWQHFHSTTKGEAWGLVPNTNDEVEKRGTRHSPSTTNIATENYLVSFFGRANYSLLDRYLFTATLRYDGSSRFQNKWALFPSFAFGWKMKNEAFLKDVEMLSDLKLRLGYGATGQQEGIGDYNYFVSYNVNTAPDSYYPLGDSKGQIYRPNAYNKALTWETTTTYNAGLDFGFFNQRFSGSVDYYFRKTTDLINDVTVAAGSNFSNRVKSNIGSLTNQGVEVSLNWKPIQRADFFWELGLNATYNVNEITELTGSIVETGGISAGTGGKIQAHAVGHPASSFYVYQQVYDKNGVPLEGVYVDRDGNGQLNSSDKYFYKNPMAPWIGGFSSKIQYKAWDFGFNLRASIGNYVYNDFEAGSANLSGIWRSEFLTNRPEMALTKGFQTSDAVWSDHFVQNGSFLKCENITLGYSFEGLLKTAKYAGTSGRLYLAASNVFTLTKYKGIDPEVFGGIDNNVYPRPFTIVAGVTLNF